MPEILKPGPQNSASSRDSHKSRRGQVRSLPVWRRQKLASKFIELECPFRWAGVYELGGQFYDLRLHGGTLPGMKVVMLPFPAGCDGLDELRDRSMLLFYGKEIRISHGGRLRPGHHLFQLRARGGSLAVRVEIDSPGRYALFAQWSFKEFQVALWGHTGMVELEEVHTFKSPHLHDEHARAGLVDARMRGWFEAGRGAY